MPVACLALHWRRDVLQPRKVAVQFKTAIRILVTVYSIEVHRLFSPRLCRGTASANCSLTEIPRQSRGLNSHWINSYDF